MSRKLLGAAVAFGLFCMVSTASAVPVGYSVRESDQVLVRINLTTGAVTDVGDTGPDGDDIDGLAFNSSGVLFGSDNDTDTLYTINTTTGAKTAVGPFSSGISDSGLSFNSSDVLYLANDASGLFTVNTTNASLTSIGSFNADIDAIAFDGTDILYAIDDDNDQLVTLNTTTGAIASIIGSLGISTSGEQGLGFDSLGSLFLVNEDTESLYSVSTTTGAATLIADLGADFESIAIIDEASVPEPATLLLLLLGLGLAGLGFARRRPH